METGMNNPLVRDIVTQWFFDHDKNKDGVLSRDEARELITDVFTGDDSRAPLPSEEEIEAEFNKIDVNGDGVISPSELAEFIFGHIAANGGFD